jgi:response regulator RpfG family c-di-GMP phosphodiesterase
MDDAFLDDLFRSAALHDIGKVGIPDRILQKPGKLSAEEFEIMKTHTVIGGETLADAERRIDDLELLRMGKGIAYYHHEKWNGSGYPYGLSGEEIPVAARIVGLADVYDALTTKRCYKEAFEHEVARKYITKASGSHFDPQVVSAFLDCEPEILHIKAKYAA